MPVLVWNFICREGRHSSCVVVLLFVKPDVDIHDARCQKFESYVTLHFVIAVKSNENLRIWRLGMRNLILEYGDNCRKI